MLHQSQLKLSLAYAATDRLIDKMGRGRGGVGVLSNNTGAAARLDTHPHAGISGLKKWRYSVRRPARAENVWVVLLCY